MKREKPMKQEKQKKQKKQRERDRFITKDDVSGWLFVLPFVIGFIFLFGKPMFESLRYSFSELTLLGAGNLEVKPVGFENYRYALFVDPKFIKQFTGTFTTLLWNVPVVLVFSLIVALFLNDKFAGRLLFRCLMFLPVIFNTKTVINILTSGGMSTNIYNTENAFMVMGNKLMGFLNELMNSFFIPYTLTEKLSGWVSNIFNIAWMSGIQIVLFLIGLQSIPSYLYEVCKIEGATKWESFWKITFPLLTPSILLVLIYTIIERCNATGNAIMELVEAARVTQLHYACALTWLYSLVVILIVAIVYAIVGRRTVYLD